MVSFVSVSQENGDLGTLALPVGWQPGDLLLYGGFGLSYSPNVPTGYTALVQQGLDDSMEGSLGYRFAQAGDGPVVIDSNRVVNFIICYRGVLASSPIAGLAIAFNNTGGGASSSFVVPAVTASAAGKYVAIVGSRVEQGGATVVQNAQPPAGLTLRVDVEENPTFSADSRFLLAADLDVPPGAVGTKTVTGDQLSANNLRIALVLASANTAPNAPAPTSPIDGAIVNRDSTVRLAWTPSDPDPGDSQSAYDVRFRPVGDPTWTTAYAATPNAYRDLAPGTFPGTTPVDYEWQARTYDGDGIVGPYSASAFFTAASAPASPTITAPIDTETIATSDVALVWSTPTQDAYQVRSLADLAGDPDPATVLYASGTVEQPATRAATIPLPVNGRTEHLQVRVRDDGLWSPWVSVQITASYTPPADPTAVVLAVSTIPALVGIATDALQVTITNPTPVGDEPTVFSNRIHVREAGDDSTAIRVAVDLPANDVFLWRGPANLVDYELRVETVGDSGATSTSVWTA